MRRDTIDYLIGLDYTFFSKVDAALQLSQKVLTGSADHLRYEAVEDRVTTSAALRLSTGFFNDTLNATVLFVVYGNRADYRVSAKLEYVVSGAVTLAVGTDIFGGPRSTLYGQFETRIASTSPRPGDSEDTPPAIGRHEPRPHRTGASVNSYAEADDVVIDDRKR